MTSTFDVNESRDGVTICTLYTGQRSCGDTNSLESVVASVRVEYTVLVPRDIRVNVSTGRGDIDVERAGSAVTASTGAGRVFVATERGPVNVSSGSGDIDVRDSIVFRPTPDVTAVTGNGLIRVALPPDFNGDIDAQSENGTFRTDFEITIARANRRATHSRHDRTRWTAHPPTDRQRSNRAAEELEPGRQRQGRGQRSGSEFPL